MFLFVFLIPCFGGRGVCCIFLFYLKLKKKKWWWGRSVYVVVVVVVALNQWASRRNCTLP